MTVHAAQPARSNPRRVLWETLLVLFVSLGQGLIVIDSILYGTIFARSKNIFVSWIAHALADIVGVWLMLTFI